MWVILRFKSNPECCGKDSGLVQGVHNVPGTPLQSFHDSVEPLKSIFCIFIHAKIQMMRVKMVKNKIERRVIKKNEC